MEKYHKNSFLTVWEFYRRVNLALNEKPVWSKNQVKALLERERDKILDDIDKLLKAEKEEKRARKKGK